MNRSKTREEESENFCLLFFQTRWCGSLKMFAKLHIDGEARRSKHADLFYSHLISTHLFQFLLANALHHITVLRLSANGPDALRKDHRESLLQSLQPTVFPIVPTSLSTHESRALTALGLEWDDATKTHGPMARIPRPGTDTTPLSDRRQHTAKIPPPPSATLHCRDPIIYSPRLHCQLLPQTPLLRQR